MTSNPSTTAALADAEIIAYYTAGTLLSELQKPLDSNGQATLHAQLVALHNHGDIDLLAMTATPEFQNLNRRHFYSIQQIYCGVIPRLDAPPPAMLEAVGRLRTQAGNDGGAMLLHGALSRWIEQDPRRAQAVIAAAESDLSVDPEVFRGALVTLGDLRAVKSFLNVTDVRRQAAIAALGGIKPRNQKRAHEALTDLLDISTSDPNDDMRFTATFAIFSLLRTCEALAPAWVPRVVAAVASDPKDPTRVALLQCLWRHTVLFSASDIKTTLAVASVGDLSSQRLIGTFEATLCHLLGSAYHDLAVDCLTELLSSTGKSVPLEGFQSLKHHLAGIERTKLFAVAVRWFRTGDPKLCEAVAQIIGAAQQAQPFDASLAGFGLTSGEMIVLCHKAVGYMLLEPVLAASFVIAALRSGDNAVEPELTELLLQALLINYGEMVVAYLKGIVKTDTAYPAVRQALNSYQAYEEALRIEPPIKELLPSSHQRGAVRQKHYVEGREIRKQAERQSIFAGLVHRSTLLYGRKAITYAAGVDRPPVAMDMKTIYTGLKMPTLQVIDPVGLDWLTRIFRMSKPK